MSDRLIRWHLSGKDSSGRPFVMGVYPMLLDESCHFLALDLDGKGWQDDVTALLGVIRGLKLPIALERSRSGNGAHVWFFFEQAVPAMQAKRLSRMTTLTASVAQYLQAGNSLKLPRIPSHYRQAICETFGSDP